MSASTEKKLRQAAREAGTDKKTLALEKEAKEKAKQKRRWTLGTIGVCLLIALILFLNSNVLFKSTALTVGDESYSASEMSYYYANQYYYWANQYGSYASLFGLDTSGGIKGLDKQSCAMAGEGVSWKDYFLENAQNELIQEKALRDYAAQNGIQLSQEDLDAVESGFGIRPLPGLCQRGQVFRRQLRHRREHQHGAPGLPQLRSGHQGSDHLLRSLGVQPGRAEGTVRQL